MSKKQSNQYDKIFKENIEAVIPGLIMKVLGIKAVHIEELPDDLQHTKERKPDVLKKITDSAGITFVLQIEFQLADEAEMVYRMAEYYIMLARKYRLAVRQFVIFIGKDAPKMPIEFVGERMNFNFPLITFAKLDYHIFVNSDKPEEIVLGILANFKNEGSEFAIKKIARRLKETTDGDFALRRYFQQLRILAQLRNLGDELKYTAMESLENYVSMEKDAFYLIGVDRGEKRGEEKSKERFVRNLLAKLALPTEQIAELAGVSTKFVEKIQHKIALSEQ